LHICTFKMSSVQIQVLLGSGSAKRPFFLLGAQHKPNTVSIRTKPGSNWVRVIKGYGGRGVNWFIGL
jgi:hypothetical protein